MNQPSVLFPGQEVLLREWGSALAAAIESMGADRPQVGEFHLAPDASADGVFKDTDACRLIYRLDIADAPALGIAASAAAWMEIATRVLTGAGMANPTPQLCLETYRELVGQSCSMLAQSLTSRLGKEVRFAAAQEEPWPPEFAPVAAGNARFGTQTPVVLYVYASTELLRAISSSAAAHPSEIMSSGFPALEKLGTLENLEMGVTVSLGTARISLGDALALGAGSVVLLSSALDDLVVVKVDGKVIATGEVVVVDNSYAIRIVHLASKDERFSRVAQMQTTMPGAAGGRMVT